MLRTEGVLDGGIFCGNAFRIVFTVHDQQEPTEPSTFGE